MSPVNFQQFYSYAQLTNYLRRLTKEAPALARLRSMGESREGRQLWVLEITNGATGAAAEKPAYLVHANIHAAEVAGTMSGLALCHHLLSQFGRDEAVTRLLDNVAFYVIPRLNPDGAEYALRTGGAIRSRFAVRREANTLIPQDVNGDGLILTMRWQDAHGNLRLDPDEPRRLLPRQPHDPGPFYRVATEGIIHDWDGGEFHEATRTFDWNRNWGANWQPEHVQFGAGDFPFSEPEMRALAEFVFAHPNIFGMLGFHTGPQALLRPPASISEDEFPDGDLRAMKELGRKGVELTGFPLYAVTDYHHADEKPNCLRGHFTEWGYEHVGLFVFEIELGTLHTSAGISTQASFESTEEQRRDFEKRLLQWHDAHPDYGAFVNWQPFSHPQLGAVEIGGWKRYLWANPSLDDLPAISERAIKFIMEHASRFPQ
ncbi:MAG: M14 family metallopeptidase, partial [Abditibacteriales bacterium]|nr:M14 family metallopeptidase [Abditibacteriales bacterium]MDW8364685.1 M14 family metallopeptidase [Abditibacteriales bacterium]